MLLQQCSSEDGNKSVHFFRDLHSQIFHFGLWQTKNWKTFWKWTVIVPSQMNPSLGKTTFPSATTISWKWLETKCTGKCLFLLIRHAIQKLGTWQMTPLESRKLMDYVKHFCLHTRCQNHFTICKLFDRSMFLLWPEGIPYGNVFVFRDRLRATYFKSRQVNKAVLYKIGTCYLVAQALHRVAEEVRSKCLQVPCVEDKEDFRQGPCS
jgi:hypothetical protein